MQNDEFIKLIKSIKQTLDNHKALLEAVADFKAQWLAALAELSMASFPELAGKEEKLKQHLAQSLDFACRQTFEHVLNMLVHYENNEGYYKGQPGQVPQGFTGTSQEDVNEMLAVLKTEKQKQQMLAIIAEEDAGEKPHFDYKMATHQKLKELLMPWFGGLSQLPANAYRELDYYLYRQVGVFTKEVYVVLEG